MKNIIKGGISFAVIGIFLLAALASFGPDEATNTTVPISDCESKPPFTGSIKVDVFVTTLTLTAIPFHSAIIYATHQEVNPDTTCTFQSTMIEYPTETNIDGRIIWDGPPFTHDNSEDLWRIQVQVLGNDNWDAANDVQVLKYNQTNANFYLIQLNKEDI